MRNREIPDGQETFERGLVQIIHHSLDHPGNKYYKPGAEGCRDQKQDFKKSLSHFGPSDGLSAS